jgi:hypothetical protein
VLDPISIEAKFLEYLFLVCHPALPPVIPAKAGIQKQPALSKLLDSSWIRAFAGMTGVKSEINLLKSS